MSGSPTASRITDGGTCAASVGSLWVDDEVVCVVNLLLISLVATVCLAAVQVTVDTGIDLVHHVRLVRARGVGSGTRARAGVHSASSAWGTAVVTIRVDTWVGCIGNTAAVRAMGAGGIVVSSRHI